MNHARGTATLDVQLKEVTEKLLAGVELALGLACDGQPVPDEGLDCIALLSERVASLIMLIGTLRQREDDAVPAKTS